MCRQITRRMPLSLIQPHTMHRDRNHIINNARNHFKKSLSIVYKVSDVTFKYATLVGGCGGSWEMQLKEEAENTDCVMSMIFHGP